MLLFLRFFFDGSAKIKRGRNVARRRSGIALPLCRRVGAVEPIGVGRQRLGIDAEGLQHRFQPPGKNVGVGNSPIRILLQDLGQDLLELFGHVCHEFANRFRLLATLLVQHFRKRLASKQRPAGQQCVHQRPKAVEIGSRIDGLPRRLLGGHVFGRAQDVAGAGQPRVAEQPCDAEVGKLHGAVGGQQQIARLDIAVDDAAVVGVAERAARLDADPRHLAPIETPAAPQFLLQTVPIDQLHRIEQQSLLLAEAEKANDVRMVKFAERFDLGLETAAKSFFARQIGGKKLDGRDLAGLLVNCLIDRPHAAAAKSADNLVRTEPFDFHASEGYRVRWSGFRNRRLSEFLAAAAPAGRSRSLLRVYRAVNPNAIVWMKQRLAKSRQYGHNSRGPTDHGMCLPSRERSVSASNSMVG